jgi:hypothetical protein
MYRLLNSVVGETGERGLEFVHCLDVWYFLAVHFVFFINHGVVMRCWWKQ